MVITVTAYLVLWHNP